MVLHLFGKSIVIEIRSKNQSNSNFKNETPLRLNEVEVKKRCPDKKDMRKIWAYLSYFPAEHPTDLKNFNEDLNFDLLTDKEKDQINKFECLTYLEERSRYAYCILNFYK